MFKVPSRQVDENSQNNVQVNQRPSEHQSDDGVVNGDNETCCGAMTFIHPSIRNLNINSPISLCINNVTTRITWSSCLWALTFITMVIISYVALLCLLGTWMLPEGKFFGLFWLIIASYTLGWSLAYIPYLNIPPVFGMLIAGMIVKNTGLYDIHEQIGTGTTAKIRMFCLTFIMIRAGLQLSTAALKEHPFFLMELAIVPCTMEFFTVSICSRYILQYPWRWAFLNGSIIACMSPVVTVNCILDLANKGYGEDRDMASLLCTASSIDDPTYNKWYVYVPSGLRDLILGLVGGLILGVLFAFLPHRNERFVTCYRVACLVIGSVMCTSGANSIAVTGGGYLASIFMAFIASTGWKVLSGNTIPIMPLRRAIHVLWHFTQPILVGIIGAEMDFSQWSAERFGLHTGCILLGLMARSVFAILANYNTTFSTKERIFVALSWLPKGTIQAALAPMTLEHARETKNPDEISIALDVVRMSVVAIVFLAPLGAIIMMMSGPYLLNKGNNDELERRRNLTILRLSRLQPIGDDSSTDTTSTSTAASTSSHYYSTTESSDKFTD